MKNIKKLKIFKKYQYTYRNNKNLKGCEKYWYLKHDQMLKYFNSESNCGLWMNYTNEDFKNLSNIISWKVKYMKSVLRK